MYSLWLLFALYKTLWLTAISSHYLVALSAKNLKYLRSIASNNMRRNQCCQMVVTQNC